MHGGSSKTGSCCSLSYTNCSQYLQYQSILIMVGEIRLLKTGEILYPLEEGMATHSTILAWGVLWTEELGGPQFIRLQRVRHD